MDKPSYQFVTHRRYLKNSWKMLGGPVLGQRRPSHIIKGRGTGDTVEAKQSKYIRREIPIRSGVLNPSCSSMVTIYALHENDYTASGRVRKSH